MTIIQFILQCLKTHGCYHIIGVPGTSCAPVYFAIDQDDEMNYLVAVNELEAGYIADGYGRFAGMSAVSVSYGVGTLSMINAIASAYTEKVPMVILNGGPSFEEQAVQEKYGVLFSHSTGNRNTDFDVCKNVTVAAAVVNNPYEAESIILNLFRKAKDEPGPVYLEVLNNIWNEEIMTTGVVYPVISSDIPEEFILTFYRKLSESKHPVLILGSELLRKRLFNITAEFINRFQIPFCTTLLSKSILDERHPLYIGTYDSDLVNKPTRQYVETSDCLISLGCIFGVDHRSLVLGQYKTMIDVSYGSGRIGVQKYNNVGLQEFFETMLLWQKLPVVARGQEKETIFADKISRRNSEKPTHDSVFEMINKFISDKRNRLIVIADTCLSSYPAADLFMPATEMFLSNPVWLSIGHGTPASIGAYLATGRRPIILTGDGGFQMLAQTFSTMVKYKIPAIILIIDNGLYGIEQFLLDKSFYNDPTITSLAFNALNRWKYELFPVVFGGGVGFRIRDINSGKEILEHSMESTVEPVIIVFEVDERDLPSEYVKNINQE